MTLLVVAIVIAIATAAQAHHAVSRAEAHAVAAAIELRASDLPGLAARANPITAAELAQERALSSCAGLEPPREAYAQAQSPLFGGGYGPGALGYGSSTAILPSSAAVAKDLAAATSSRGLPCVASEFAGQLRADGFNVRSLSSTRLRPFVTGSDGTFSWRVRASAQARGVPVQHIVEDDIAFALGQVEVSLAAVGDDRVPPSSTERRLAASLLARARSAIG